MRAGDVKAMRDAATRELVRLERRVAPLLQEIEKKKREIELLDELLQVRSGKLPREDTRGPAVTKKRRKHSDLVAKAKQILVDVGHPLHVAELHKIFLERGFPIPGMGTEANLISHLRRSQDIVRVKRGFYALADSHAVGLDGTEASRKKVNEKGPHRSENRQTSDSESWKALSEKEESAS